MYKVIIHKGDRHIERLFQQRDTLVSWLAGNYPYMSLEQREATAVFILRDDDGLFYDVTRSIMSSVEGIVRNAGWAIIWPIVKE